MTYVLTLLLKLLMLLKEMVLLWVILPQVGVMDEAHMDVGRVEEVASAP